MIPLSLADICDRSSIVRLKIERGGNNKELQKERDLLESELAQWRSNPAFNEQWIPDLYKVNGMMWDLESDIRKGKENELGLEEVGRRAIAIRNLNVKRIAIKNAISESTKTGFIEKKLDHASEE